MKKILLLGALGYLAWHSAMSHADPVVTATASGSVTGDRSISADLSTFQSDFQNYGRALWYEQRQIAAPDYQTYATATHKAADKLRAGENRLLGESASYRANASIRVSDLGDNGIWNEALFARAQRQTIARARIIEGGIGMAGEALTTQIDDVGVQFSRDFGDDYHVVVSPMVQSISTTFYANNLIQFSSSSVLHGGRERKVGINLDAGLYRSVGRWTVGLRAKNLYAAQVPFHPDPQSKRATDGQYGFALEPTVSASARGQFGGAGVQLNAQLNPSKGWAWFPGHQWLSAGVSEQLPLHLTVTAGAAYNIYHKAPDTNAPVVQRQSWKVAASLSGECNGIRFTAGFGIGNAGFGSIKLAIRGAL